MDHQQQFLDGRATVDLQRGIFTDTVAVWLGTGPTWPGPFRGGLSIRYCRHRYGPTLYRVVVEMIYGVLMDDPSPFPPLPASRRSLNRYLATVGAGGGA